jgi:hypothetical protein
VRIFGFCGNGRTGRGGTRAAGASLAAGLLIAVFSPAAMAAAPRHEAASAAGMLRGVSCASASSCAAVGGRSATSKGPGGTLAEKWNGTKWSVVTSPDPAGSNGATLDGVACTSAKSCLAVGDYFTSSRSTLPTAEKWNGTKWSVLTVPAPSGTTDAFLDAASCVSSTDCWAVGGSMDNTLAESWNGTKWSIVSSPSPNPAKPNYLTGLSCPSAKDCWAVGETFPTNFGGSLTEQWNGSKWSVVSTPTSKNGQLIGDACFSTSACMSVGIGNNLFAVAQVWKGSSWTATTPKKPSGATSSEFNGVSCPAGSACEAVGNDSNTSALAEGWNGTAWAIQKMPAISGSTDASLENIACPGKTSCWAVGVSDTSSGSDPLIEQWNGKSWSVTAS